MAADEPIDTEEVFHGKLQTIVNEAASNGIEVEGAWPVLNDDPRLPDWDLEIVALAETDE